MGFFLPGVWFSSWYVVSIDTGHIAQSPQSSPRWSPAFKREPVLSVSSFRVARMTGPVRSVSSRVFSVTRQRQNSRGTNPSTLRSCWLISYWPNQIPCPSSRIKVGEEAGGNLYLHESAGAGGGSRGDQQGSQPTSDPLLRSMPQGWQLPHHGSKSSHPRILLTQETNSLRRTMQIVESSLWFSAGASLSLQPQLEAPSPRPRLLVWLIPPIFRLTPIVHLLPSAFNPPPIPTTVRQQQLHRILISVSPWSLLRWLQPSWCSTLKGKALQVGFSPSL